jgi:hypothetical protein
MGTLRQEATETGLVCFGEADEALPVSGGRRVLSRLLITHSTLHRAKSNRLVHYAPDGAAMVAGASREDALHVPTIEPSDTPAT